MADTRRLIGIDLAWGKRDGSEPAGSGCAELKWENGALTLSRPIELLGRVDEIVKWIRPDDGDWVVAIDAPLVICNKEGQRSAEKQANRHYGRFDAYARPAYLDNPDFGKHYQGRMIRKCLKELGGTLVEWTEDLNGGPLFFETYPHVAMVELFHLRKTIKYKKDQCKKRGGAACQHRGQRELADHIRHHLCGQTASPRLSHNATLDDLLRDLDPGAGSGDLKAREDKLDGLICAYTAAWLDAGRDLVGLGEVGEGVMIAPRVQDIGPPLL